MMNGVKHAVARTNDRPALQYIKVAVTADCVTFYALDGYRAAKVQIKQQNECEFECLIKPIEVKATCRHGDDDITTISYDDESGVARITLNTEYGAITYSFKALAAEFIDIENIYALAKEHDREYCANATLITQAVKAIAATTNDRTHKAIVFEARANELAPFILRSDDKTILNEQLILPIRRVLKNG